MSLDTLLVHMLKQLSHRLAEDGCNDFTLEDWMDEDEQKVFAYNAWKANGASTDEDENLASYVCDLPYMPNFVVASTLAYMVRIRTP